MADAGLKSNTLAAGASLDNVMGHSDGSLVLLELALLGAQLLGTGPVADKIEELRSQITSGGLSAATWSDLMVLTGATDGAGAEVLDSDSGNHLDATVTGYDGATVSNAGRYSWSAIWSRWVWIGPTGLSSKAPLSSPALTDTPTAPTATTSTNTDQIATTAFAHAVVQAAITALIGMAPAQLDTLGKISAAIDNDENFAGTITDALLTKAPLASPALTGTPIAPTAAPGTATTQIATTAFVQATAQAAIDALVAAAPGQLDTLSELAEALGNDPDFAATITGMLASKAPLASPALTGVPTAPTAVPGTSTAQIATTAFVQNAARVISAIQLLPSTFDAGATYWQSAASGVPGDGAAPSGFEFVDSLARITADTSAAFGTSQLYMRDTIVPEIGRQYRLTCAYRITGQVTPIEGGAGTVSIFLRALDAAYDYVSIATFLTGNAATGGIDVIETTVTCTAGNVAPFWRAGMYFRGNDFTTDGDCEVLSLAIVEVSDQAGIDQAIGTLVDGLATEAAARTAADNLAITHIDGWDVLNDAGASYDEVGVGSDGAVLWARIGADTYIMTDAGIDRIAVQADFVPTLAAHSDRLDQIEATALFDVVSWDVFAPDGIAYDLVIAGSDESIRTGWVGALEYVSGTDGVVRADSDGIHDTLGWDIFAPDGRPFEIVTVGTSGYANSGVVGSDQYYAATGMPLRRTGDLARAIQQFWTAPLPGTPHYGWSSAR